MGNNPLDHVDDYLSGRLSEEATDEFETNLLFDEELQKEVALQQALRQGLRDESATLLAAPPPSLLEMLDGWVRSRAWAYAASVIAVAGVLLLTAPQTEVMPSASEVDLVYVERTRSAAAPVIPATAGRQQMLSIDAIEFKGQQVTLSLAPADGKELVNLVVQPTGDDLVNVVVPPMTPGSYELKLVQGEITSVYTLDVRARQ